jgi:hypothetical protein
LAPWSSLISGKFPGGRLVLPRLVFVVIGAGLAQLGGYAQITRPCADHRHRQQLKVAAPIGGSARVLRGPRLSLSVTA